MSDSTGNRPGRGVYVCRDLGGEYATVVVGAGMDEREEVAKLIRRLGWELLEITDALTPARLRREVWKST